MFFRFPDKLVTEEEMPQIQIDLELCNACGVCVMLCPAFVLEISNEKVKAINPENCLGNSAKQLCSECVEAEKVCTGCIVCVRNCPTSAIEIIKD